MRKHKVTILGIPAVIVLLIGLYLVIGTVIGVIGVSALCGYGSCTFGNTVPFFLKVLLLWPYYLLRVLGGMFG